MSKMLSRPVLIAAGRCPVRPLTLAPFQLARHVSPRRIALRTTAHPLAQSPEAGQTVCMGWRIGAEAVLVIHLAFVIFIVVGAVLIRWARWVAWPQLAALAYGAAIQAVGFVCPLTPLEKSLRRAGGDVVYEGGFIGHYITPVLYPGELTMTVKLGLVIAVAAANVAAYTWVLRSMSPTDRWALLRLERTG